MKNTKPIFTIRKIRNRNPRLARFYRNTRERIWRLATVIFLAIVGVASLFMFGGNFESENLNTKIDTQFFAADANEILGYGFEDTTGFAEGAENTTLQARGGKFATSGEGLLNAAFYNVKDYFKLVAGSMAFLYLIFAAAQIVVSSSDEGIQKGKKNLKWGVIGLVSIFAVDTMVVAFFEGGGNTPGGSLFAVNANGEIDPGEGLNLFRQTALYFKHNASLIFQYLKTLAGAFAILFIFLAGSHMISAGGNEEKIEKEKKFLIHSITAFVTLLIVEQMIFGFLYPVDPLEGVNTPECVEFMRGVAENGSFAEPPADWNCDLSVAGIGKSGSNQILGIVKFFESLIGGIAIFFIVYSGVSIIASMGNEEQVTKHKKTLIWSLAGLAVIILSETLVSKFFFVVDPDTGNATMDTDVGIATLAGVTNFIATFVGVFSVISIIIAGIIWVANFGNTELAEKSKKIIIGAIVGVVLSVSAYAIVKSVTVGNPEGLGGESGISVSTDDFSVGVGN